MANPIITIEMEDGGVIISYAFTADGDGPYSVTLVTKSSLPDFDGGTGTELDPYIVGSARSFTRLAERVAAGETADMPGLTGWWTNNVLTLEGVKTEQYGKLKTVNAEIHRLGERYMLYRNVDTFCGSASTPVRAVDGSHVTVGEMVVREGAPGQMAYFVLASDDPFDEHPASHRYEIKAPGKVVRAIGKDGDLKIADIGGGTWSFTLRSSECALVEMEK